MAEGVSCLCLTYGRPELLEEAVESFKRQRWDGPKELVVVNDHPAQELLCADDEVVVVNLKHRFRTVGEKRNFSVALASYDNLLTWDDDDIHLPWRIEETMKALPEEQFFLCPRAWVSRGHEITCDPRRDESIYHGGAAYTRHLFEQIGGYGPLNGGEDLDFERRIRAHRGVNKYWKLTALSLARLYLIVRRGHGHYHTRRVTNLEEIDPEVREGRYRLRPHWRKDYCGEVGRLVDSLSAAGQHVEDGGAGS